MANAIVILLVCIFLFGCSDRTSEIKKVEAKKTVPPVEAPKGAPRLKLGTPPTRGVVNVDLSSIQGRQVADLNARYLGFAGVSPSKKAVDFDANLTAMWEGKINRPRGVSRSTLDNAEGVLAYYNENRKHVNIGAFIAQVDTEVDRVKKAMDWSGLCYGKTGYDLSQDRCQLLLDVTSTLYGRDMVAYGLTELMPTADGQFNVRMLDILLRHAGQEYVDSIPAMSDGLLSLGFYQFTSHAVNGKNNQGASKACRHAPEAGIAGSVVTLRNGEHHRAALCFAIHNLAVLIKMSTDKEVLVFQKTYRHKQDELVQYIATAHHLPGSIRKGGKVITRGAVGSARAWLANGAKTPYMASLSPYLKRYAVKTQANLYAVYSMYPMRR